MLNYIDICFLGLAILAFLIGFARYLGGKKCFVKFIFVSLALVGSYFIQDRLFNAVAAIQIKGEPALNVLINLVISKLPEETSAELILPISNIICGLVKVVLFVLTAFVILLITSPIKRAIKKAIKKHAKSGLGGHVRKKCTFISRLFGGLFSSINCVALIATLLLPIFVLIPVAKNLDNLDTLIPGISENEIVVQVVNQTNNSKLIALSDRLLSIPNNKITQYKKIDGESGDIYADIKNIGSLTKILTLTQAFSGETESSVNIVETLCNLADEDIVGIFELAGDYKSLVISNLTEEAYEALEMTSEDLELLDFKVEGAYAAAVLKAYVFEEGQIKSKMASLSTEELSAYDEAIANSKIIKKLIGLAKI